MAHAATARRTPGRSHDQPPQPTFVAGPALDLFAKASARLRRAVPSDGAGWFAFDPSTLLPVNPTLIENVDPGHCDTFWKRECQVEDAILFRDLARAARPAATLRAATGGEPHRSARFREYLEPSGYGDELRALFRQGDQVWGALVLLRSRAREPFTARDVARVNAIGPSMAAALAAVARTNPSDPLTPAEGPGTAIFDAAGALTSLDEQAERWFIELGGPDWTIAHALTGLTSTLVARARAIGAGHRPGPATARLRTRAGRWLVITASPLRSLNGGPQLVAIVIEPATSTDVAPLLVEAYSLTVREQEVTRAVARGLSNTEIAAELVLSPHTVRDHLKAVFGKIDVRSRGELVAKLFADHYGPVHSTATLHTGY